MSKETQKCLQLLKQIWTATSIGKVSTIIVEHYQLMARLAKPVLEDTTIYHGAMPSGLTPYASSFTTSMGIFYCNNHGILPNEGNTISTSWMTY